MVLFTYRGFASVIGIIAGLVAAIVVAAGIAAALFLFVEKSMLSAAGALVLSFFFAFVVLLLIPAASVTLIAGERAALKIVPGEPSVLSNLGLSYALTKHLNQAEATLRQAAADPKAGPKVRQNLALVVGLEGRFGEAERIARADLPQAEADANAAYLRDMLARQKDWKKPGRTLRIPRPDAGT